MSLFLYFYRRDRDYGHLHDYGHRRGCGRDHDGGPLFQECKHKLCLLINQKMLQ